MHWTGGSAIIPRRASCTKIDRAVNALPFPSECRLLVVLACACARKTLRALPTTIRALHSQPLSPPSAYLPPLRLSPGRRVEKGESAAQKCGDRLCNFHLVHSVSHWTGGSAIIPDVLLALRLTERSMLFHFRRNADCWSCLHASPPAPASRHSTPSLAQGQPPPARPRAFRSSPSDIGLLPGRSRKGVGGTSQRQGGTEGVGWR